MNLFFMFKDKKLGIAQARARYDLPLHNSAGSRFLLLLVALMTFLAMLALCGFFAMNALAHSWSSGLENQATIEIPAQDEDGKIRNLDKLKDLSGDVEELLRRSQGIREFSTMSRDDVGGLVAPWLGEDIATNEMPLPALVSVRFEDKSDQSNDALAEKLKEISANIELDQHESWLGDILRLAATLRISSLFVVLVIGLTTVMAIAGAVRSRMAEFHGDIELLHLMGASNNYISRQFQRHSLTLAFKGSLIGLFFGGICIGIFALVSGQSNSGLMPTLSLGAFDILMLLALPAIASAIAYITARYTALRTLSALPL